MLRDDHEEHEYRFGDSIILFSIKQGKISWYEFGEKKTTHFDDQICFLR